MKNYEAVIAAVNEDISCLRASAIQYQIFASLLTGTHMQLCAELKEHAKDDLEQSAFLVERIALYGAEPTAGIAPYRPTPKITDPEYSITVLGIVESLVIEASQRFKKHLDIMQNGGPAGLIKFYLMLCEHEEEHLNTITSYMQGFRNTMEDLQPDISIMIPPSVKMARSMIAMNKGQL